MVGRRRYSRYAANSKRNSGSGEKRFGLRAARHRRDRTIACGRQRRRRVRVTCGGERIGAGGKLAEKRTIESVASRGRINRSDRVASDVFATIPIGHQDTVGTQTQRNNGWAQRLVEINNVVRLT